MYGMGEIPLNGNGVAATLFNRVWLKNSLNVYGNIEKSLVKTWV